MQWRGHALVDATRQIEIRTVAGAVETTLPVRVDIRRRMIRTETRRTAKMRADADQHQDFRLDRARFALDVIGLLIGLAFRVKQIVRSEEHTSELQSLMRISYAVFCLQKNNISHI